jgi:phage gp16-like protein
MKTKPNEGRVNVAIGPVRIKELSTLAKKHGTSKGALARAFILDGVDQLKSGSIEIQSGVIIGRP